MAKETNRNYDKYLNITKNEVHTKFKAIIRLSTEEYKVEDNDLLDDEEFELMAGETSSFSIPGTFEIEFPEQGDTINIFLPFLINLIKPDEYTINSKEMIFYYDEGDLIFNCFVKKSETNIEILNNMFENRVKYLRGHLEEQLYAIWSQLKSTTNYRMCHLSLVLSLLYAKVEVTNNGKEELLIRHTKDQEYKKEYAINTKDSSHLFNLGAQSFNYGYTNEALIRSVFKNRYNIMSKFEELYPEQFKEFQTINLNDLNKTEKEKTVNAQALTYTLDKNLDTIKKNMVKGYSDLENVMAGRYNDIQQSRKN